MPFMDRESFIALLDSLGDPDDAKALEAARTVHRRMVDAGVGWDALLVPAPRTDGDAEDGLDLDLDDAGVDDTDTDGAGVDGTDTGAGDAGGPEDRDLIDRMLADYVLSDQTRQELTDLRKDIAAGEFSPADSRYVRQLARRLKPRAGSR
ncbi:hypothetical protein [Rhodospirillum centenum]|uniref:Uncharacterized protein n=1 Tax=Rhodospirillum centenum (strain ATCC 51521 / SW) TaxID=414684 RepID=B6IWZ7_RHOCS|nr:hypothetical protein [Rhodospirillum centenum]ACJ00821.1 hypothetical protein RC1_3463 [Rhodospirillum centenum SW]